MSVDVDTAPLRSSLIAAILSADADGVIQPPDGVRWFSADFNELQRRDWGRQHGMRRDRLWFWRLTPTGMGVKNHLRREGYSLLPTGEVCVSKMSARVRQVFREDGGLAAVARG